MQLIDVFWGLAALCKVLSASYYVLRNDTSDDLFCHCQGSNELLVLVVLVVAPYMVLMKKLAPYSVLCGALIKVKSKNPDAKCYGGKIRCDWRLGHLQQQPR